MLRQGRDTILVFTAFDFESQQDVLCQMLKEAGYKLLVVKNSGIFSGLITDFRHPCEVVIVRPEVAITAVLRWGQVSCNLNLPPAIFLVNNPQFQGHISDEVMYGVFYLTDPEIILDFLENLGP